VLANQVNDFKVLPRDERLRWIRAIQVFESACGNRRA